MPCIGIVISVKQGRHIHSCPAVYSLRASSGHAESVQIAEFTINDRYQDILAGILAYHADIIGFSCYIWNTQIVTDLIADIRALLGDTVILYAGGPEASYGPEVFLGPCDFVMCGEGEKPFALLMEAAMQVESELGDSECSLPGQPDTAQILNDIAPDPEIKDAARTRTDDLEMQDHIQAEVNKLWDKINTDNIAECADLDGYFEDFYKLFGFGADGIDYEADTDADVKIPSITE